MPSRLACRVVIAAITVVTSAVFPGNLAKRWRACASPLLISGKIFLTHVVIGRRHGQARGQTGPQGGRADRGALPEPAPRAGTRPRVPVQRVLRRPRRGPGQIRDGAEGQGGRGPGHRGRGGGPGRRSPRGCACPPARCSVRWPAAGSATPKAADLPARETRKEENPSLS